MKSLRERSSLWTTYHPRECCACHGEIPEGADYILRQEYWTKETWCLPCHEADAEAREI